MGKKRSKEIDDKSSKKKKKEHKQEKQLKENVRLPNILITGTPGTGKTTTASMIAKKLGLKHLDVGKFIKENNCHEQYDDSYDTYILDEDKLLDLMEPLMTGDNSNCNNNNNSSSSSSSSGSSSSSKNSKKEKKNDSDTDSDYDNDNSTHGVNKATTGGGYVVDYHSCELFPERWFDLVLVLQVDTSTLHDRLVKRGYNEKKLQENIQCEIMMVVLEAAHESYAEEIVVRLPSDTKEDMKNNVSRCQAWLENWKEEH